MKQYNLQPYGGMKTRHICPSCGRKRCFTLYVSEDGEPLDETVGRCDHESSCGYHYTPKEYFHDHPDAGRDWRDNFMSQPMKLPRQKPKAKPLCTLPDAIVAASVNPAIKSDLTAFLASVLGAEATAALVMEYRLGVTKARDVIYFQIDIHGRCRTGKIMKYDPQTGHRIKNSSIPGCVNWAHSILKKKNRLPQDWELTQCLFGEHLLPKYPGRSVALVESEKTALICSALMPEHVWLATGGKSQLSEERLRVLRGRTVIAFPDIDAYDTWRTRLGELKGYSITISDYLEQNATPKQREAHIDIADLLIQEAIAKPEAPPRSPMENPNFLRIARCISPEAQTAVAQLMADLDLIPVSITPIPTPQQS